MTFQKHDQGKVRFDLFPPKAIEAISEILTLGANKYAAGNWVRAPNWGRYYAALQRHLLAWWGGESNDAESGCSHLAHAGCCLVFLLEFERLGLSLDDRPKPSLPSPPNGDDATSLREEVARLRAELAQRDEAIENISDQNAILESELFALRRG
jgi:hypothetical protein